MWLRNGSISAQENYGSATQNWLNFQTSVKPDDTYQTTMRNSFKPLEDRKEQFQISQNALTRNPDALEEYRQRWTSGNQQFQRSYPGSAPFVKTQQQ